MAYRNGAADFAALYVAEAAGLATREAIEAARAQPPPRLRCGARAGAAKRRRAGL
jgi:hypothetical protein